MLLTPSVSPDGCPQVSSARDSSQTRRRLMTAASWDGYQVEQASSLQPAADPAYRQLYVGLAGTNRVAGGLLASQVRHGLHGAARHCLHAAFICFVCPAITSGVAASACKAVHAGISIPHGQQDVAVQERNDRLCPSRKLHYLPGQHLAQHLSPCGAQAIAAPGACLGASVLSL